jgi:hypothetical protein
MGDTEKYPFQRTKMADPILKSSLKTGLNSHYCEQNKKKFDKFQLCLKTDAS